jgi:hypothetical protein
MHFNQLLNKERSISDVPVAVKLCLVLALMLQLLWHSLQGPVMARGEDLSSPLSVQSYVMSSLGEPIAAARFLNLWLQSFDNQPGISLSFHQLDYTQLMKWLDTSLQLDPAGHYPMLVAARVYGNINDPIKQRLMMDYILEKFNEDPDKYWRWLAHAVIIAKHEIKDQTLALKYADALTSKATGKNVPYWAKDMKIIVLEDMGEIEAAKLLVGALLESKQISDPYELTFLMNKIATLEEKSIR